MTRGEAARAKARARGAGAVLAALAVAAAACAGPSRRSRPPEPALRLWAPGLVYWSGGRRTLGLAVENDTGGTVSIEAPAPRRATVVLYVGSGADRACAHEADASGPPGAPEALAPGESRELRIDLQAACGRLPPGEYRYEVGYEAPAAGSGPAVRLRTAHGHVVVEAGGSPALDRGSLGSGRPAGD